MATILVIEDDEQARAAVEALLRYEGHDVVLAANGLQGLLVARDRRPDLVLSDIRMPGMSGMEFCQALRKDPEVGETYVILATGYHTPESKTEGITAGADDYIGKPLRADDLHARVRMGLRVRAMQKELARLRASLAGGEKVRAGMEASMAKLLGLRSNLMTAVGSMLDLARRVEDALRRGESKDGLTSATRLREEIEALRGRLIPRKE